MTVLFSTGFEDQVNPSVWPGAGGGSYDPTVVSFGDPVTGNWCIAGQTRRTSANHRRGIYVPLDSEHSDLFIGGVGKVTIGISHRFMGLFVSGVAVLEVGCFPTTSPGSLWLATDPPTDLNGYVSTNKAAESGAGVEFGTNIWRYLTLRIQRRATDGDASLFMDGSPVCKLIDYAELGLDKGPITSASWNNRANSTSNNTQYVYWDDLWIATDDHSGARIPALQPQDEGHYTEGDPSVLNAPLDEMVADIPPDDNTYIEVQPDDAVSFVIDDTDLVAINPRDVASMNVKVRLSGPTSWVVFCRIGTVDYDLEQIDVVSTTPVVRQVSVDQNPATGLPWETEVLTTVEFGIRNGVMD